MTKDSQPGHGPSSPAAPKQTEYDHHPAVLMLHGFFGNPRNWDACAAGLSACSRVLVPQFPLFGAQHRRDRLEHVMHFLGELLETEKARRVVVVGNSLGGQLAVTLATREPDRVAGLVLTGSSGLFERNFSNNIKRRPDREYLRGRIAEIFHDPSHVTEEMIDDVLDIAMDRHKALDALLLAKDIRETNVSPLLPRVRCPVLLIWGEDDKITPPSTAFEFQKLLPDARLVFLPKCGHAAMMEHPAEFNRLVEEFVQNVCTTPLHQSPPYLAIVNVQIGD